MNQPKSKQFRIVLTENGTKGSHSSKKRGVLQEASRAIPDDYLQESLSKGVQTVSKNEGDGTNNWLSNSMEFYILSFPLMFAHVSHFIGDI